MPKRTIYSRAIRIKNGEIPGLKVSGPPGETVRQVWLAYVNKKNKPSKLKQTYNSIINYIKDKLSSKEEIDPRDKIITGLETYF